MPAADGSISAGEAVAKAESGEAVMSFIDGESPADSADAILAEVLGDGGEAASEAPAEGEPAKEGEAPAAEAAPAEGDAAPATPETPEATKLRKAWAKLHGEKQSLLEEKQAAKRAVAEAETFRAKATEFDSFVQRLREDPVGLLEELEGRGLTDLQNRVLQGFVEREKSPAERAVKKLEREIAERDAREKQAQQERVAAEWRDGIVKNVQGAGEEYDLVNSLGLHSQVIDVLTGYWERHNAVLDWKTAAKMVEDHHAERIAASKRYGKRAPAPQVSTPETASKDASSAKAPAPAKRAPTLSAVPVAEAPSKGSELSSDPDVRYRQLMAEMGFS